MTRPAARASRLWPLRAAILPMVISKCAPSAVSNRKWRPQFGTVLAQARAGTGPAPVRRRAGRPGREQAGGAPPSAAQPLAQQILALLAALAAGGLGTLEEIGEGRGAGPLGILDVGLQP